MLKTLLRTVLVIIVLAGVFFFALRMWESRRGAPAFKPEAEIPSISLRQIEISSTANGATVKLSDVSGSNYTIAPVDAPKALLVDVANVQLGLLQTTMISPHALINKIEASRITAQGKLYVRVRIDLNQDVTFRERLQETSLYIDLTPKVVAVAPTPPPVITTPTPQPRAVAKPTAHKKAPPLRPKSQKSVAKKEPKKSTKKRAPIVASRPRAPAPLPMRTPFPEAKPAKRDQVLADLGIDEGLTSPPPAAEPPLPHLEPEGASPPVVAPPPAGAGIETAPPAPAEAPSGTESPPLDLDVMFADGQPTPAAAPTQAPKVAAIPPPTSGKFDTSQILAKLPGVTEIEVSNDGSKTVVTIKRESNTPHKVFKMVNPNRVVVDFLDSANKLKKEYPAYPGTKVERITTQQFAGPDGTIARIMIYVGGLPVYEKSMSGSSLVLKLP